MWTVILNVLLLFATYSVVFGEELPTKFVSDFVEFYFSKSVVLHVKNTENTENLARFVREFNLKKEYVSIISSEKSECDTFKENVDLHFVLFDKCMVDHTMNCFMHRKRYNKEPWVLYTKLPKDEVIDLLQDAKLDLDDEIHIAITDEDHQMAEIWEIYKINNETMIESIYLGSWTMEKGFKLTKVHKWYRRRNLKGHHFLTTSLVETPFTSKIELNSFTGKYEIEGSFADLLHSLRDIMNFTFTLEPPADNNWGGRQADGSWNGMMNLVQKELVDFGKIIYS